MSHTITLLHSGRDYFPALLQAIAHAQHSVVLETYIFANDVTGNAVRDACIAAAQRGVRVTITVDGFGSGAYGRDLVAYFLANGVQAKLYRPQRWWQAGLSPTLLRRLHRKLCAIDAGTAHAVGFVGGINILDDHNHAPHVGQGLGARFDFAVQVTGPVVAHINNALSVPSTHNPAPARLKHLLNQPLSLVLRDNVKHRFSIQAMYFKLLAGARREVWLANAYFLPGRKLRRAITACQQRGVQVHLLLQGQPEYWLQHYATQALYGQMLAAGVRIYEYQTSFLHAKVATFDGVRATVGSSNIDPFSLMLAKEANLYINDTAFAQQLQNALHTAAQQDARPVLPANPRPLGRRCMAWFAYGVLRAGLLVAVGRRY